MRLLRIGRRLARVGRRLASACSNSPCCGGPYIKYVRCGLTDAVYVHDAVLCTSSGPVNTGGLRTFLYAGYCWTRSGTNKYTAAQLPDGATVIDAGSVECVPDDCSATVCNDTLYIISWPCKKAPGPVDPVYYRADLLGGNLNRVYGGRCLNGGTIRRGDIAPGAIIVDAPLTPALFAPSCCAVFCTPNQPCVPGCCCSGDGPAIGQSVSFAENLYNGRKYYTTTRIERVYTVSGITQTRTDTFVDYEGFYPPTTKTTTTTFAPVRFGACDCSASTSSYRTTTDGYLSLSTTYSRSCGNVTQTISNDAYGSSDPDYGYERTRFTSTLTASFSNDCNACAGPSPLMVGVATNPPVGERETAGDFL